MCKLDSQFAKTLGLSQSQYDELKNVFAQFSEVETVIAYGSRAKGNFTPRSDLDLVVTLKSSDRHTISQIQLALDASDLVPAVDLQDFSSIKNKQLKDHIQRRGIQLN